MKINLRDYPAAGPVTARAAARAKSSGRSTIFATTMPGRSPTDVDFIDHGRRSWVEWWQGLFSIGRSRKAKSRSGAALERKA